MSRKDKKKLKNILKGYKVFNRKMILKMKTLGFDVNVGSKHVKLKHSESDVIFTVGKTVSDYKAGLNCYSIINKSIPTT